MASRRSSRSSGSGRAGRSSASGNTGSSVNRSDGIYLDEVPQEMGATTRRYSDLRFTAVEVANAGTSSGVRNVEAGMERIDRRLGVVEYWIAVGKIYTLVATVVFGVAIGWILAKVW